MSTSLLVNTQEELRCDIKAAKNAEFDAKHQKA
jgi:hypothetical protein